MILLIKIVAIIAVVVLLLVVAGGMLLLRWLRRIIKGEVDAPSCPPCRVNPEPEAAPQWRSPDKVRQYACEFKALGFQEIGAFTIPEMGGLQMLGFVHPAERLYGLIY